jgi:DNA-directed RNA polymerase specialized sigma24 family protein
MLAAVERLPEPHRSIVKLRHVEGRSFAEIGTRLACSPFRARRAWYEALQLLKRELKDQA